MGENVNGFDWTIGTIDSNSNSALSRGEPVKNKELGVVVDVDLYFPDAHIVQVPP